MESVHALSKESSPSRILSNRRDRRSLFWSLGLFPLPIAVAFWKPEATLWIAPLTLYLAFCAGVLTHYHNHVGVFQNRTLNRLYSVWLSVFYGFPIFSWIPTHNLNHHRYTNGPKDATSTFRSGNKDTFWELLYYPIRSSAWQFPALRDYVRLLKTKRRSDYRWAMAQIVVLVLANLLVLGALVARHGAQLGSVAYLAAMLLPALMAPYFMMFINYLQHVGCDPMSVDNHSRNFVGRWENWLVFEAGLHTVHHEHPTTHWSEYPALHAARQGAIEPVLEQRNVFAFLVHRYLLGEQQHLLLTEKANFIQAPSVEAT
jgi:beta-carotene hydroxylase